jgi:hypothetical protein
LLGTIQLGKTGEVTARTIETEQQDCQGFS